jgi:hypothetical protein
MTDSRLRARPAFQQTRRLHCALAAARHLQRPCLAAAGSRRHLRVVHGTGPDLTQPFEVGFFRSTTTGANPAAGSSVEHGVDNWQIEVCK